MKLSPVPDVLFLWVQLFIFASVLFGVPGAARGQNAAPKMPAPAVTALPFPGGTVEVPSLSLEQISTATLELDDKIGSYPPRIKDEADRRATYSKWSYAMLEAEVFFRKNGESEPISVLLLKLYRQGHNIDVTGAGAKADRTLRSALEKYPRSAPVLMEAAYFYLQTNPEYARDAEAALLKVREILGTNRDLEVERGLMMAYLFQKRKDEALKQIDHCLSIAPDHAQLLMLKKALSGGGQTITKHMDPPKATKSAPDAGDIESAWMKSFYRTRDTGKFPAFWDSILEQKTLEDPKATAPMIGFVSQVVRQYPKLMKGRMDDIRKLPEAAREPVALILWYCNSKESRAILKKNKLGKILEEAPPQISAYPVESGASLDFCWGYYFATGDTAALDPIIGALDFFKFAGALERFRNGQRTDADKDAAMKEAIWSAAMWSLQANGTEDLKILAHLEEKFHSKQTPEIQKKCLMIILSKIRPEK